MARSRTKVAGVEHLTTQRPVKVMHNGKMIGYFLPAAPGWDPNDSEMRRAFEELGEAVQRVREDSGLDEEGLVLALTGTEANNLEPIPSTKQAPPTTDLADLHPVVRATMGVFRLKTSEPVSIEQIMDEGRQYRVERSKDDEVDDHESGDARE